MYKVTPFKSIGPYMLGESQQNIERIEKSKSEFSSVRYPSPSIDFKDGVSVFVGMPTYNGVIMGDKLIKDQSFLDICNFLTPKTATFFCDGDTLLVAKDIGVACYFEDEKIREIGILSESYLDEYLIGLEIVEC